MVYHRGIPFNNNKLFIYYKCTGNAHKLPRTKAVPGSKDDDDAVILGSSWVLGHRQVLFKNCRF